MNLNADRNRSTSSRYDSRRGEAGPNARHSDAVVRRARKIDSWNVYTLPEIRLHLLDEGHDVPLDTLAGWLSGATRAMA